MLLTQIHCDRRGEILYTRSAISCWSHMPPLASNALMPPVPASATHGLFVTMSPPDSWQSFCHDSATAGRSCCAIRLEIDRCSRFVLPFLAHAGGALQWERESC